MGKGGAGVNREGQKRGSARVFMVLVWGGEGVRRGPARLIGSFDKTAHACDAGSGQCLAVFRGEGVGRWGSTGAQELAGIQLLVDRAACAL
jgi:hypothetical protein